MQTVHEMLRRAATRARSEPALVDAKTGLRLSHAELHHRVEVLAAVFSQQGLRCKQRVAFISPNSLDAAIAILALHRLGAVPALLNPRLKASEIAELIEFAEITVAIVGKNDDLIGGLEVSGRSLQVFNLEDLVHEGKLKQTTEQTLLELAVEPDEPGFIFYTSGTTGLPKAVVIPHRAVEQRVLFMATQAGLRHGSHNVALGLMPLYHVIGFFAVLVATLAFDGRYVVVEEFKPSEALKAIEKEKVSTLFSTPTHLDAITFVITQEPNRFNLTSLQNITFAGATMPDTVLTRVNNLLPGEKINIYGTTEAMNSLYMRQPTSGNTVRPGFFSEVRIVKVGGQVSDVVADGEEGELIVRAGDAAFLHYLNQPKVTSEKLQNGWYRTSDAAMVTDTGAIQVLGRLDDMIISGGENIHPFEVECVLSEAPGVEEVVVVGVKDQRWGQCVSACVVAKADHHLSEETLDLFCRESGLADYKRPRKYEFVPQLPKNALNKVLRREVVRMLTRV